MDRRCTQEIPIRKGRKPKAKIIKCGVAVTRGWKGQGGEWKSRLVVPIAVRQKEYILKVYSTVWGVHCNMLLEIEERLSKATNMGK